MMPHWRAEVPHDALLKETMHYGLTGGWVQKFKGSYLLCFLHSALVFKDRGQCDHHAFPLKYSVNAHEFLDPSPC